MGAYIARRVLQSIIIVALTSVVVFIGISVVGDPVEMLVSSDCDQHCLREATRILGLDRPLYEQYFIFLHNALGGNLGNSFLTGLPALEMILERLPATLELAFMALFIAIGVGIPLGLYSGLYPNSAAGRAIQTASIIGFSLPGFWVGLLLIMVFAVGLGWLPATGRGETTSLFGIQVSFLTWDGLRHMLLPAINLSLFKVSIIIRLARAGTREAILQDYVKFARSKGIRRPRIVLVHVLKNILIPIVTVIGLEFGSLIAYGTVTETIFAWPGIGKLLVESILILDRPVVVSYLMITVILFSVINLIVDILYTVLDPRIRLRGVPR